MKRLVFDEIFGYIVSGSYRSNGHIMDTGMKPGYHEHLINMLIDRFEIYDNQIFGTWGWLDETSI